MKTETKSIKLVQYYIKNCYKMLTRAAEEAIILRILLYVHQ